MPAELPRAAVAVAVAVERTMSDLRWLATLDQDERGWMLVEDICRELHALGPVQFPSAPALRESLDRQGRDQAIRSEFDGRNYRALARKYKRSQRQIRRIVDRGRGH